MLGTRSSTSNRFRIVGISNLDFNQEVLFRLGLRHVPARLQRACRLKNDPIKNPEILRGGSEIRLKNPAICGERELMK